jgi:tetratricopeptide (TPR) repeat protein
MEQGDSVAALDVYQRCLASNKTSDGSTLIDANRVLAHCFSGTISDERVAGSARPMQDFDSSLFPRRGTRNGSALVLPWRTAYLAMAPTRTVGDAPPEFAMCIDWELVAALSKFEDLSCSPVSADREIDVSLPRLTAEGFDFLLEGCIGRIAGHDQLVMRLRALHVKGEVFWSQRVCRKVSAGGLLEADFASALAPQIACEISKHKAEIVENCEEAGTGVGRLILRASRSVGRLDRHNLADIERRLSEAIKGDSRRPALLAWSAYVQLLQLGQGWVSDIEATRRRMGELIDKFISLNPDNASVLPIAGHVLAFTQHRLEEGLSLHEKALSRNPNLPLAWLFSGLAHTYAGAHEEAISRIQRAKLLSPADPQAYFIENGLSLANLLNGDNAGALAASQNAIRLNPNFSSSFKVGVSASGYLAAGRDDSHLLKRLLVLEPRLTVERVLSRTPFTRRADQTHLAEGLRLAGLPG